MMSLLSVLIIVKVSPPTFTPRPADLVSDPKALDPISPHSLLSLPPTHSGTQTAAHLFQTLCKHLPKKGQSIIQAGYQHSAIWQAMTVKTFLSTESECLLVSSSNPINYANANIFCQFIFIRAARLNKILSDEAFLLIWSSRHIIMTFLLKKLFSGGLITLAPGGFALQGGFTKENIKFM